MTQDAKSAERQRLAAALRANLRRRKAAPRPAERHGATVSEAAVSEATETSRPGTAAARESKG